MGSGTRKIPVTSAAALAKAQDRGRAPCYAPILSTKKALLNQIAQRFEEDAVSGVPPHGFGPSTGRSTLL